MELFCRQQGRNYAKEEESGVSAHVNKEQSTSRLHEARSLDSRINFCSYRGEGENRSRGDQFVVWLEI
jgi:hypothetical protein